MLGPVSWNENYLGAEPEELAPSPTHFYVEVWVDRYWDLWAESTDIEDAYWNASLLVNRGWDYRIVDDENRVYTMPERYRLMEDKLWDISEHFVRSVGVTQCMKCQRWEKRFAFITKTINKIKDEVLLWKSYLKIRKNLK